MLLSLLYHRVGIGKYANSFSFFEKHFDWIQKRYQTVVPGDPLSKENSICLTFDDATFDFYYYIFPLLKRKNIKAVISVPTKFISESVNASPKHRLQNIPLLSTTSSLSPKSAYCSWDELRDMQNSGLIHIASHSVNHVPLTSKNVDVEYELFASKTFIEKHIQAEVFTFVYPYGKFNQQVHTIARKYYSYIMRIGNAINFSWSNKHNLIYRVNADNLASPYVPFHRSRQASYFIKYYLNTIRKK